MSQALDRLNVMLGDVDNLLEFHPAARSNGKGRPAGDLKPLLRSSVVLTYAAWEVYVEDSMIETVRGIAQPPTVPARLPEELRKFVGLATIDPWLTDLNLRPFGG
jgi:hypothetical protein